MTIACAMCLGFALGLCYIAAYLFARLDDKHREMRQAVECARCKWTVI